MKRSIAVLFVLAVLGCVLSKGAEAQTSCTVSFTIGSFCTPNCLQNQPPNTVCDNPCINFCGCHYTTNACSPPAAASETCTHCLTGGRPIDLATGNTFINQTDLSLPGLAGGLTLARTWNSIWPATQTGMVSFMFGPNWVSTYQERIFSGSDGYIKYARNDGSFWSFGVISAGSTTTYGTAAPANAGATLTTGATNWTVTFKNGEKRLFDNTSGSLKSIIDRNGNTTQLSYDGQNRLTTVTDPASRHLNFTYVNSSSFLVSGVTSDAGISLSYAYDAQGRLSQVTRPDNTTLSFQYDTHSNITAVLDTNGKVLESHTYDSSNRGLTSSRANGVESLTVTYPQ
jgi:YD repeat-containing protein